MAASAMGEVEPSCPRLPATLSDHPPCSPGQTFNMAKAWFMEGRLARRLPGRSRTVRISYCHENGNSVNSYINAGAAEYTLAMGMWPGGCPEANGHQDRPLSRFRGQQGWLPPLNFLSPPPHRHQLGRKDPPRCSWMSSMPPEPLVIGHRGRRGPWGPLGPPRFHLLLEQVSLGCQEGRVMGGNPANTPPLALANDGRWRDHIVIMVKFMRPNRDIYNQNKKA